MNADWEGVKRTAALQDFIQLRLIKQLRVLCLHRFLHRVHARR